MTLPSKKPIMIEIEDSEDETSTPPPPRAKVQPIPAGQPKRSQASQPSKPLCHVKMFTNTPRPATQPTQAIQTNAPQMLQVKNDRPQSTDPAGTSRPSTQPSSSKQTGYQKLQPQKDHSQAKGPTSTPRLSTQTAPSSSSSSAAPLQASGPPQAFRSGSQGQTRVVDGIEVTVVEEDDPALQRVRAAQRDCRNAVLRQEWIELEELIGKVTYLKYPDGTLRYEAQCQNCVQDQVVCLLPNSLEEKGRSCHHCRIWHRQCDAGNRVPPSLPVTELRSYLEERDRPGSTWKPTEERKVKVDKRPHSQSLSGSNPPANTSTSSTASKKAKPSTTSVKVAKVQEMQKPNSNLTKGPSLSDHSQAADNRKLENKQPVSSSRPSTLAKSSIDVSQASATELCNLLDDHIRYFEQLQDRVLASRTAIEHLLKRAHQPPSLIPEDALATVTRGPVNVQKLKVLVNTPVAIRALRTAIEQYQDSEGLPNAVQERVASKAQCRQSQAL
ncbi:unnamed protein product [Sympodiomycopsis kandeliae]